MPKPKFIDDETEEFINPNTDDNTPEADPVPEPEYDFDPAPKYSGF